MKTDRMVRRVALVAGGGAVVAMAMLNAGCGTSTKEEPSTPGTTQTTTSPSTSPEVSPTEKVIRPGGDESFSPTIKPHNPGAVCERTVGGVCVR